ncbi:hypothetical protein PAXINDRAFT_102404 [Paxillus involutus ATCC 200175]|uniref:MATH domain-containing protein n=1 Tax=Paxillus involutus ATCC 200175 TaxID=664439 RepID=A0A0C9TNY4_PAXIN|nr:hypothetical protein PAXINDRAFT_102404 [Paxillus involutus ATCC 200175]
MERISDTVISTFHITIKDGHPTACSPGDPTVVYSDTFGLGWRLGISYNKDEWFAKVRLYLDHNHSHTEKDEACVTTCLKDSEDKDKKGLGERAITISNFGHGQPALLDSFAPAYLAAYPYVTLTVVTKARAPRVVTDPLAGTALALRQSMEGGDLVDTKFYVFSAKRQGTSVARPRVVYAHSPSLRLMLPKSTLGGKQSDGLAVPFLVNLTGEINEDSVLHAYDYEQDSDLDEDEDDDDDDDSTIGDSSFPGEFQAGSSSQPIGSPNQRGSSHGTAGGPSAEPPSYSVSTCQMTLVRGIAYKMWFSFIYYRYTGQISFLPLTSQGLGISGRSSSLDCPPPCSPKSMYRLAVSLGDERLQELAFRAIKEGLSKDNIVGEAFTWFTAQYSEISKFEVEKVYELRKLPEVSLALRFQMKAVSSGEKPWSHDVLTAVMDKLNPFETTV